MSHGSTPRMTQAVQLVLKVLISHPTAQLYGLTISREAGLPSGTVHPILARLEQAGWLTSSWEDDVDPREAGRPLRRYYSITPNGAEFARDALDRAEARRSSAGRRTVAGLGGLPGLTER